MLIPEIRIILSGKILKMEESISPLREIYEESDSEYYINNIENDLNFDYEKILPLLLKQEEILKNGNEKNNIIKKPQKFIITRLETNKKKILDNISIQTENSSNKENSFSKLKFNNKQIKLFKCICGKVFHTKENQILHFKNIHLHQKPYKCSYCDSKFSHRNGKTYHERIFHTFILPYKCKVDNCKLAFASKSALTYHIKNKHYMSKL